MQRGVKVEDNKQLIEQMYGSNLEAQKQQLTQNYNSTISGLDKQIQENAKTTQNNLNRTAVEADRSRKNYQEVQNAYGLSSGAMAQARLAQDNQLQADMTAIRAAQQTADQNIAREKNLIAQQYQSEIAKAQAENDMQKAQALYQLAKQEDERLLEKQKQAAASMAAAGDFSLYGQLYGLTDQQLQTLQNQYQQEQGREAQELERQRQETAAEAMASIGDFSLYGQLYGLTEQQVAALEAAFRKENSAGGSKSYTGGSTSYTGGSGTSASRITAAASSSVNRTNKNTQSAEEALSALGYQSPYDPVIGKRIIDNPVVWDTAAKAVGGSKKLEEAGYMFRPRANNRRG